VGVQDGVRNEPLSRQPDCDDLADHGFDGATQAHWRALATALVGHQRRGAGIPQEAGSQSVHRRPVQSKQLGCALRLHAVQGTGAQWAQHPGDLDFALGDRVGLVH